MNVQATVNGIVRQYNTRNPFALCAELGIDILRHEIGRIRGYSTQVGTARIVVLNTSLKEHEAHFVCAHELAHILLHANLNRIFMDNKTFMLSQKYENQADAFAAFLLFGERPVYNEQELNEQQMAECLNVTPAAAHARFMELQRLC